MRANLSFPFTTLLQLVTAILKPTGSTEMNKWPGAEAVSVSPTAGQVQVKPALLPFRGVIG